jgi:hypothetical protein
MNVRPAMVAVSKSVLTLLDRLSAHVIRGLVYHLVVATVMVR